MKKWYLKIKSTENKRFYYTEVGSEAHGRPTYILWVSPKLVTWEDGTPYLILPTDGRIDRGMKPTTLILRPSSDYWITDCYIESGYRGRSRFDVIEPPDVEVYEYHHCRSPRGSLGISTGALLQVPSTRDRVTVKWWRDGRLYSKPPTGLTVMYRDGRTETLEGIEELEELEDIAEPTAEPTIEGTPQG